MFGYGEVPSSVSLLLQCGYRSKACTNHRATKLDGNLHKLCEFHRRKANLNQQKLHKRHREERALYEDVRSPKMRPAKKFRPSFQPTVEPILHATAEFPYCFSTEDYQQHHPIDEQASPKLSFEDMDILDLLLFDMQPQSLPPLESFLPDPSATVDNNSVPALIFMRARGENFPKTAKMSAVPVHELNRSGVELRCACALTREMQCAYRSKFCDAPRAVKLDGSLHKLCDFHRRKANANQQRLHRRKKRMLEEGAVGLGLQSPRSDRSKKLRLSPESPQSTTEPIDGHTFQSSFDQLEVKILEVLLFGAECSGSQVPEMMEDVATFSAMLSAPSVEGTLGDTWSVTL
ncbi:hypothetical protein JM16_006916 [Phytophthora kernoviae]|uniref:Uncharacterized protein n=1 Tax=Phytophthora kernoviae TaxID=325452 RepID=A0A8T0LRC5_9STRA|nr:hypothetical protein JM16_006916 [Phytophthora kernoviae]